MRGSFKGAIRICLRFLSFLFNDVVFLHIPRKSPRSLRLLFSFPTAPTSIFFLHNVLWFFEGPQGAINVVQPATVFGSKSPR